MLTYVAWKQWKLAVTCLQALENWSTVLLVIVRKMDGCCPRTSLKPDGMPKVQCYSFLYTPNKITMLTYVAWKQWKLAVTCLQALENWSTVLLVIVRKMDGCSPISLLPLTILHLEWMSFLSLYPKQNYHAHLCGMEAMEDVSYLSTSLGKLEYGIAGNCQKNGRLLPHKFTSTDHFTPCRLRFPRFILQTKLQCSLMFPGRSG